MLRASHILDLGKQLTHPVNGSPLKLFPGDLEVTVLSLLPRSGLNFFFNLFSGMKSEANGKYLFFSVLEP
jgi:hypothetical protein